MNVCYVMTISVGMALLASFISTRGDLGQLVGAQAEIKLCRFVLRAREPEAT